MSNCLYKNVSPIFKICLLVPISNKRPTYKVLLYIDNTYIKLLFNVVNSLSIDFL